jgi:transcriptional regulator GlxA family with amidase domain
MQNSQPPVTVKLLAVPETTASILYSLYDVFDSVDDAWSQLTGGLRTRSPFEPKIVSPLEQPFTCRGGLPIVPHESLRTNAVPDVIIVPDLSVPPDTDPRGRWAEAAAYIRRMHEAGATVCSVCTGSLLLADSGILDGRPATTHWGFADMIRRYYPDVKLEPERLFVAADGIGSIITTGGPATWEELALYLITRYRGPASAIRTSKVFLLGDHSEGMMVYAGLPQPRRHDDAIVGDAQAWFADNYRLGSPVSRAVERSGLPERTFKRRFKAATGMSPIDYVQTLRTEEAKQMLETSGAGVDEIGIAIGYEDPTFFRRLFKRATGVTPSRYRQRWKRAFAPEALAEPVTKKSGPEGPLKS